MVTKMDRKTANGSAPPKGTLNEARWSEILQAARDVFSEKGYEAATIQDIASRVGLLKGSLYYYIENKQDLLYQLCLRQITHNLDVLRSEPGIREGDAIARLTRFIDRYMAQLEHDLPWNRVLERGFDFNAERTASINAVRHQLHLLLKDIVTQGMADGVFDPTVDASVAVNGVLSLMNATLRWRRPTGRRSFGEVAQWYQRFILHGLTAGTPS